MLGPPQCVQKGSPKYLILLQEKATSIMGGGRSRSQAAKDYKLIVQPQANKIQYFSDVFLFTTIKYAPEVTIRGNRWFVGLPPRLLF
jgi:hypothetical protein